MNQPSPTSNTKGAIYTTHSRNITFPNVYDAPTYQRKISKQATPQTMKPVLLFLLTFSSFSLLSLSLVQCATLPLQLMTLLSLKSSLKDPFSTLHDWDPSPIFSDQGFRRPIWCSWSGIKCNPKTNEVASLDLSHRNLSGVIPAEIRYLSSLLHLNLSGNSFDGPFQASIFEIMRLGVIDISCNQFNSTFPTGISKLKSLRVFNAYSNSFVGPLPWEFIRLRFLEYLNLGGNYFEGAIPPGYGSFLGLRSLYLQGNLLGGPIPSQLGFMSSLEHLEIGYNEFHGGIPRELALLSNLIYLDMASSNLSSSLPVELGNLTKLETMLLFQNHFTGEIPPDFKNSQSIKYLDLSNNHITGEIPEWLASLKNLSVVNLMNNNLSGEIPAGIGELPNLEVLQLWNNSLTGILPQNLGSSAKLTKLDVSSNYLSGKIPPNLCLGNKLVKLLLFSNRFDHGLPPSLANCTSLNRLRVQDNMLNGSIPCGFGHLQNLTFVDMSRNNFSGKIPDDISNAVALRYLNLTGNSFQSNLPRNIWSAPNLQVFSASSSKLHGEIPDFIGCQSVYQIELGGNSLNGSIPWDIGHCEKLLSLNLTRNLLSGIIPWEISALPSITDVDLSYNLLTGTIPSNFDNCSTLESFNVSFNLLSGPIPSSSTIFRNLHPSSFSGNQGLCGGVLEKPCAANIVGAGNMEVQRQPRRTTGAVVWITAAAFGMGLFVLIAGTKFVHAKYGHKADQNQDIGPWKLTAFQRLNFTADDVVQCLSMTNTIIGMGSTGMVYRVEMPYGEIIAVKKLWGTQKEWQSRKRSGVLAEVDLLGNVRHRNIVRLLGCCSNKECTMLLYEYMPNGNLDEFLHGKNKSWSLVDAWLIRYKIALGVAQGICYLHHDCDPAIVHRDLKPSNILLDGEMEARVADFGVAKLVQGDESMSVIAGSYGYIAPEYAYTLQVDEKSDTYSYGVVLMEVLSGRKSVDAEFGEGNSIVDWVRLKIKTREGILDVLDKKAGASCESVREEMIQVLRIALLCTSSTPADRPSMREVVMMLQEARPKRKFPGSVNDGEEVL